MRFIRPILERRTGDSIPGASLRSCWMCADGSENTYMRPLLFAYINAIDGSRCCLRPGMVPGDSIEDRPMTKSLMPLALSAEDLEAVDAALITLEARLAGLISLRVEACGALAKMGDQSEAFCRRTLTVLAQNPQIVPPGFDLIEAQADLAAMDALRPRLARLRRLTGRIEDTETALCSEVMSAALEGHALLKASECNQPAAASGTIDAL
jgi:hypothetical protein